MITNSTMSAIKRNKYFDVSSADESESPGYDSGAAEEAYFSRTTKKSPCFSKRPKPHAESLSTSDDSELDAKSNSEKSINLDAISSEINSSKSLPHATDQILKTPTSLRAQEPPLLTSPQSNSIQAPSATKKSKPLTSSTIATTNALAQKAGVLYLSRIPPFMRPSTVRSLLSAYGPINRLFLTPEPPSSYLARRARGGNRKKSFVDGWVEFASKRHARVCAESINARTIGGRGGRFYGDDVWNAKYLRGFTWGDLMADVRGEEREREERIRVGIGRAVRERKEFLRQVEKSKIEATRRKKAERRAAKRGDPNREEEKPIKIPDDPPLTPSSALPNPNPHSNFSPSNNHHHHHHHNNAHNSPPSSHSEPNPLSSRTQLSRGEMRFRQTTRISGGGGGGGVGSGEGGAGGISGDGVVRGGSGGAESDHGRRTKPVRPGTASTHGVDRAGGARNDGEVDDLKRVLRKIF